MFYIWLAARYLRHGKSYFSLSTWLGILGLAVGVGSLVVAMAVVSGFVTTLKSNIIDVSGHLIVTKSQFNSGEIDQVLNEIKPLVPQEGAILAHSPFLWVEGMIAHEGKINGIFIEGIDTTQAQKVVNLNSRITQGKLEDLELPRSKELGVPVMIGQGIAHRFGLNIGDSFKVVIPKKESLAGTFGRPQVHKLKVVGIMELGRYEYNSRFILMNLKSAQNLLGVGTRIDGIRLKLSDAQWADPFKEQINMRLSEELYWAKSWRDHEKNLFEAVELEKPVIFFVLFIMVIAASFNVSSTLFVGVINNYSDISTLKSLGMKRWDIIKIFAFQGLLIGVIGSVFGFLLGGLACVGFVGIQDIWPIIPAETYRIESIGVDLRFKDLLQIFLASVSICFIATLAPAITGSRLKPVEGLRYD